MTSRAQDRCRVRSPRRVPLLAPRQSPPQSLTSLTSSHSSGGSSTSSASPANPSGTSTATRLSSSTRLSTTSIPSSLNPSTLRRSSIVQQTSSVLSSTPFTSTFTSGSSFSSSKSKRSTSSESSISSSPSLPSPSPPPPSSSSSPPASSQPLSSSRPSSSPFSPTSSSQPPPSSSSQISSSPTSSSSQPISSDASTPSSFFSSTLFSSTFSTTPFNSTTASIPSTTSSTSTSALNATSSIFTSSAAFSPTSASSGSTPQTGLYISETSFARSTSVALSTTSAVKSITTSVMVPVTVTTTTKGGSMVVITTTSPSGTLVPGGSVKSGLANKPGALAGLVVGVTVAVGILALLLYLIRRRFGPRARTPPPNTGTRMRVPFDEDEMMDAARPPVSHAAYAASSPDSGDGLLAGPEGDPDAPASIGHSRSLSHGGHSLVGGIAGFTSIPARTSGDLEAAPHSSAHSSSAGHIRGGVPAPAASSSGHEYSAPGNGSYEHDAGASSSSHSAQMERSAWFNSDELALPTRPGPRHESSGSGSGSGNGSGSGSGNSSQPILARPPVPPSAFLQSSTPSSPTSRRFSLPWLPGSHTSAVSARRKSSAVGAGDAPTFFESVPRPRSPPPATFTLPQRPPFLTPDELPFPSASEEDMLTAHGLLREDIHGGSLGAPMASVGELSLRDDVDYTRPIAARMFTSTTLDTIHGTGTGSGASNLSDRPSIYSVASAGTSSLRTYENGPTAASVPPIVVDSGTPPESQSPTEQDPMLPTAI